MKRGGRGSREAGGRVYHNQHMSQAHVHCPVLLQDIDADLTGLADIRMENLCREEPCITAGADPGQPMSAEHLQCPIHDHKDATGDYRSRVAVCTL